MVISVVVVVFINSKCSYRLPCLHSSHSFSLASPFTQFPRNFSLSFSPKPLAKKAIASSLKGIYHKQKPVSTLYHWYVSQSLFLTFILCISLENLMSLDLPMKSF